MDRGVRGMKTKRLLFGSAVMVKRSLLPAMCLLPHLLDEEKGYQEIRRWRWRYGTRCPHCTSNKVVQIGRAHV